MKVLIAGGTGFMGRHLIESLVSDSHQVWVLYRETQSNRLRVLKLLDGMGRQPMAGDSLSKKWMLSSI